MTLSQWKDNGWLQEHQTSPSEIQGMWSIVRRDLVDATGPVSADWRFGIAYNAALKLCTILLHASGYRAVRDQHHHRTIAVLPLILGSESQADAAYLDTCRAKRNTVEYDLAGAATDADAAELLNFANELKGQVMAWLQENRPELLPAGR